jgi:hypothetical protein
LTRVKQNKIVETKNGAKVLKKLQKSEIRFDNLVDLEKFKNAAKRVFGCKNRR